jgi:hypothetical protein
MATGTANPYEPEGECNHAHQDGGPHPPVTAALSTTGLLDERLGRAWHGVVQTWHVLAG